MRNKVPVNQRRSSTEEVAFGDAAYEGTGTYISGIQSTFKKAKYINKVIEQDIGVSEPSLGHM